MFIKFLSDALKKAKLLFCRTKHFKYKFLLWKIAPSHIARLVPLLDEPINWLGRCNFELILFGAFFNRSNSSSLDQ